MNIEEFVNEYLKEHRHDVLLNPYNGLIDFANAFKEQMTKGAMQMYRCYDEEHNLVGFSVDYDAPGAYGNYVSIIVKEDSHEQESRAESK